MELEANQKYQKSNKIPKKQKSKKIPIKYKFKNPETEQTPVLLQSLDVRVRMHVRVYV